MSKEQSPAYLARPEFVAQALEWLAQSVQPGAEFDSPGAVRDYLRLQMGNYQREVFGALLLDARHRVIRCEEMFFGSIKETQVHPRELVRAAVMHGAAACVLFHNHPSGHPEPSRADEAVTQRIKSALDFVDCRVLDHFIVTRSEVVSFAERGIL